MILSAATLDLLRAPQRCIVEYDADSGVVQLRATTSQDYTGWRISGGGDTPGRVSMRKPLRTYPQLAGNYAVALVSDGVVQLHKTNIAK